MATIATRYDRQRGCGWRKPGGMYLVSAGLAAPCGALPIPLHRCPACGNGIKPARGFTFVDAGALLAPAVALCQGPPATNPDRFGQAPSCGRCPLPRLRGRHGLIWVGGQHYKTPDAFTREAMELGVSRRIAQLPKGLTIGETWIFLAHRDAIPAKRFDELGPGEAMPFLPGIFHAFRPTAIEYVVKGTETEDELDRLEKRGLTLVRIERHVDQLEATTAAGTGDQ